MMSNAQMPILAPTDTGDSVRRLQRALRRTADLGVVVDGSFRERTEKSVREFQAACGLTVDGLVGPRTWAALPDGAPMPILAEGCTGPVVNALQRVLGGPDGTLPVDGKFGKHTYDAVVAFQRGRGLTEDGVVGDQTWSESLHAAGATLESAVGLIHVVSYSVSDR